MPYRTPHLILGPVGLRLTRTPRPAVVVGRLLAILLAALALALALAPWQQSAQGQGRVVAYAPLERQQTLEAPIEGRIVRWHVGEGSKVRKGDVVVEISDNDADLLARMARERAALVERLAAAEQRALHTRARGGSLAASRSAALDAARARATMARERTRASRDALRAAEAAVETARLNHDRQRALHDEGLASRRALELADLEELRARTEAERARAALAAARSEEAALSADAVRAGSDGGAAIDDARATRAVALAEVANTQAELARIDVRLARQAAQSVVAPTDGTILRLLAAQGGEMVKPGDPLAVIVPDTNARAVELWLDGNDVPLVSEGRHVRLQFEGWPAVQFAGWPSVAVGTFGGKVALVDAGGDGAGRFRVLIVPDGDDAWPQGRFLRQGTRAQGWVLLDRVRLGWELWRQWNGFPPSVAGVEAAPASAKKAETGSVR